MTVACLLIVIGLTIGWSAAYGQTVYYNGFEGGNPVPTCTEIAESSAGWQQVRKAWTRAWTPPAAGSAPAVYPTSSGSVVPIGANKGTYSLIEFVPNPNEVVSVYWEPVQSQQNYKPRPAIGMYFALSPCPGDLRAASSLGDPFLLTGCRRGASTSSMQFHTLPIPSDFQSCQLVAGTTYYMHIIAANPDDGLTAGEHTCASVPNSANGCDVQATHKPIF